MGMIINEDTTLSVSIALPMKVAKEMDRFTDENPDEFKGCSTRSEFFLAFMLKGLAIWKDEAGKKAKFKAQEATRSV